MSSSRIHETSLRQYQLSKNCQLHPAKSFFNEYDPSQQNRPQRSSETIIGTKACRPKPETDSTFLSTRDDTTERCELSTISHWFFLIIVAQNEFSITVKLIYIDGTDNKLLPEVSTLKIFLRSMVPFLNS